MVIFYYKDEDICRLAAYKMKVEEKLIKKMLEDNEHNKHTTLYYLLSKKKDRGDLELEKELEEYAEKEMKKEQDKLKVKKPKLPSPLLDLNRPEMFDARHQEHLQTDKDAKKRQPSRSISTSIDNHYLNELLQTHSIKHKRPQISLPRDDSYEINKNNTYTHSRKKSTSKSKGKRSNSREAQVRM